MSNNEKFCEDRLIDSIGSHIFELEIAELQKSQYERFEKKVTIIKVYELSENKSKILYQEGLKKGYIVVERSREFWMDFCGKEVIIDGANLYEERLWKIKSVRIDDSKMTDKIKNYFSYEDWENVKNVFSELNEKQKEYICDFLEERKTYEFNEENNVHEQEVFLDYVEQKRKFLLLRKYYPTEIRNQIEYIIQHDKQATSSEKIINRKLMTLFVNTQWASKLDYKCDINVIKEKLEESHYKMEKPIATLLKHLEVRQKTGKLPEKCLLFNGSSGCGKSTLIKSFAKATEIPLGIVNVGGMNDVVMLRGSSRNYDNGNVGAFTRQITKLGSNCIMLFEDVDKIDDADVTATLLDILDNNYSDNFLEFQLDCSKIWFVATSNNTQAIHSDLLGRMQVIEVDEYSPEDKCKIAKDYIFPKMMERLGLSKETLKISDEAMELLSNEYTVGGNIRDIEENLYQVGMAFYSKGETDVVVTEDNLQEYFDIKEKKGLVKDLVDLKKRYLLNKSRYNFSIRKRIEECFAMVTGLDRQQREHGLKTLFYLVNIFSECDNYSLDIKNVKKVMESSHYGMKKSKETIMKLFAGNELRDSGKAKALLFDGPPGVGKTTLAKSIAKALEIPYHKIPLNGVKESISLTGSDYTYKNADVGMLIKGLIREEVCSYSCVVVLDEIDKCGNEIYDVLHNLLDNVDGFWNSYLETNIPTDKMLFIATSNDKSRIPPTILDRLEIIELDGYSFSEKKKITESYIIPKVFNEYHIDSNLNFDMGVIDELLKQYCTSTGVRDVERAVHNIVQNMALYHNLKKDKITVKKGDLKRILGRTNEESNIPMHETFVGGQAIALGICGNIGRCFPVQSIVTPYSQQNFVITGLPKDGVLESVKIAMTVVSNTLKMKIPPIHIHFGDAIAKDGPSAGITICVSLLSLLLKEKLSDCAFSGELDITGHIWPVGGIKIKIVAAEKEGLHTVYIPKRNYEQLMEDGELENFSIKIIPIETVEQVMKMLFHKSKVRYNTF